MNYLIIDLQATAAEGVAHFWCADLQGTTPLVDQAGRFAEEMVNSHLERFDNGAVTRAILESAVWERASNAHVLPLHTLDLSKLSTTGVPL